MRRTGHSRSGAVSPISIPVHTAARIPISDASPPAISAEITSMPVVATWIAALARPSTSRGSAVWRTVTATMTNATASPSPNS